MLRNSLLHFTFNMVSELVSRSCLLSIPVKNSGGYLVNKHVLSVIQKMMILVQCDNMNTFAIGLNICETMLNLSLCGSVIWLCLPCRNFICEVHKDKKRFVWHRSSKNIKPKYNQVSVMSSCGIQAYCGNIHL